MIGCEIRLSHHRERIWLSDIMAVFPQRKTLPSWSGKLCTPASCKNISTCRKNFRETTWPPGSSWRPLVWREGGLTPLFHDLCKEYTQGPPSDAIPLKSGCLGQLAVEECCVLVLHLYLMPLKLNYAIPCYIFCNMNEQPQREQQLFFKSLNIYVALGLVVWSAHVFFSRLFSKSGFFEVYLLVTNTQSVDSNVAIIKPTLMIV